LPCVFLYTRQKRSMPKFFYTRQRGWSLLSVFLHLAKRLVFAQFLAFSKELLCRVHEKKHSGQTFWQSACSACLLDQCSIISFHFRICDRFMFYVCIVRAWAMLNCISFSLLCSTDRIVPLLSPCRAKCPQRSHQAWSMWKKLLIQSLWSSHI
jgi:hypothetical protein